MTTVKQKLAFKKILQGKSISQSMREVGYAESTARRTDHLTRSDGWKELMEKSLSDKSLLKVHKEGLESMSVRFTPEGEQIEVADYATRHKYLESGYKIKGRMKEPEGENKTLIINIVAETAKRYDITIPSGSKDDST